jgi:hypothetical protein
MWDQETKKRRSYRHEDGVVVGVCEEDYLLMSVVSEASESE